MKKYVMYGKRISYKRLKRKVFKEYKKTRQYFYRLYGGGFFKFKRKKKYSLKKMQLYLMYD
jgi:hypothetical protein